MNRLFCVWKIEIKIKIEMYSQTPCGHFRFILLQLLCLVHFSSQRVFVLGESHFRFYCTNKIKNSNQNKAITHSTQLQPLDCINCCKQFLTHSIHSIICKLKIIVRKNVITNHVWLKMCDAMITPKNARKMISTNENCTYFFVFRWMPLQNVRCAFKSHSLSNGYKWTMQIGFNGNAWRPYWRWCFCAFILNWIYSMNVHCTGNYFNEHIW